MVERRGRLLGCRINRICDMNMGIKWMERILGRFRFFMGA